MVIKQAHPEKAREDATCVIPVPMPGPITEVVIRMTAEQLHRIRMDERMKPRPIRQGPRGDVLEMDEETFRQVLRGHLGIELPKTLGRVRYRIEVND